MVVLMHHIPRALGFVFFYQATSVRTSTPFRCLFQGDPIYAFITSKEGGVVWVTPTLVVLWLIAKTQTQALGPMNGNLTPAKRAPKAQQETWEMRTEKQLPHQEQKLRNWICFIFPIEVLCETNDLHYLCGQRAAHNGPRWGPSLLCFQLWLKTESKPLRLWFPQSLCCMSYPNPSAFTKPSWCSYTTFFDSSGSISWPLT